MKVTARAKVNLYLHITGKRPNGYHELDSLVVFTEFGDQLEFADADDLSLEVAGPFAVAIDKTDNNMVIRAAAALRSATDCRRGAHIRLHKYIPVGAGLGGGSSDAAATLMALNQLWQLSLPISRLVEIGLTLGSDVPVCLLRRPARIRGIGENVERVALKAPLWILLASPGKPLLTAEVYKAWSGHFSNSTRLPESITDRDALMPLLRLLHNDLEAPAVSRMPVIADILKALSATDGCLLARMSGSGAACFGLYASQESASQAQAAIKQEHPDWWATVTRLMS